VAQLRSIIFFSQISGGCAQRFRTVEGVAAIGALCRGRIANHVLRGRRGDAVRSCLRDDGACQDGSVAAALCAILADLLPLLAMIPVALLLHPRTPSDSWLLCSNTSISHGTAFWVAANTTMRSVRWCHVGLNVARAWFSFFSSRMIMLPSAFPFQFRG